MKTIVPNDVLKCIRGNKTFLLMTHQNPDNDAIGSIIAFGILLKKMRKHVTYYVQDAVREPLSEFKEAKNFSKKVSSAYDVIVYLDCSSVDYAYKPNKAISHKYVLCIDHHETNNIDGVKFVECVSSTGELVYLIADALSVKLSREMRYAIYAAISSDTGSFKYPSTSAQTHEVASKLKERGSLDRFAELSHRIHDETSWEKTQLYCYALCSLSLHCAGRIAATLISKEEVESCGGMKNIDNAIHTIGTRVNGVDIGVSIVEIGDCDYKVSLRVSPSCDINVADVAKKYGGGGHAKAAGFFYNGNVHHLLGEISKIITSSPKERCNGDKVRKIKKEMLNAQKGEHKDVKLKLGKRYNGERSAK